MKRILLHVVTACVVAGALVAPGQVCAKRLLTVNDATGEVAQDPNLKATSDAANSISGTSFQLPNLIITGFSAPATLMTMEDFKSSLILTVQNVGDASTVSAFNMRVVLSSDAVYGSNDFAITNTFNIGPLEPLQSVQVNIITAVLPPDAPPGPAYLAVWIDNNLAIVESDETDNTASTPVTVVTNPTQRCAYYEDFQTGDGGWTPNSIAGGGGIFWQHEIYQPGVLDEGVMWCGTNERLLFPPGYGNNWSQFLTKTFTLPVGNPTLQVSVQYDVEPDYDFLYAEVSNNDIDYTTLATYTGNSGGFSLQFLDLTDYAGQTVQIRFRFFSDVFYSDEDGYYPSDGAARIDNVVVTGYPPDTFDTDSDGWVAGVPQPVGDGFRLEETAYCPPEAGALCYAYTNGTPVDPCWQWVLYDPFTLQMPVSAPGPGDEANFAIESPAIPLPADATTFYLGFDTFLKLPLASGVFYQYDVASPAGGPWASGPFIIYSDIYRRNRTQVDISNLITPGTSCQIRLRAFEVMLYCGPEEACGPTAGPYFDNVQLTVAGGSQDGAIDCSVYPRDCGTTAGDFDGDGIDDGSDLEPFVSSAPFDRNGDGVLDEVHGERHVEYIGDGEFPVDYVIHDGGATGVSLAGTVAAIQAAMNAWAAVPNTDIAFNYLGTTSQNNAGGMDGINLVTFKDTEFQFPSGVLAVGLSTSFTVPQSFMGTPYRPGQIFDADMIFNPNVAFRAGLDGPPNGVEIQSVGTHEAGHLIGISHTCVVTSTMFYVLPPEAASLELEDQLTALKAYYTPAALPTLSQLTGTVTSGATGNPIPGAIVFAIDAVSGDTTGCEYTMPDGSYQFVGLPTGNYYVGIHPLNKTSTIGYIGPENINARVSATAQTKFIAESYDAAESNGDDASARTAVAVTAGSTTSGIDIVTNIDSTPPSVVSTSPALGELDVVIDPAVLVEFTEAIDENTLSGNFELHDVATQAFVSGNAAMVEDGKVLAFVPSTPLMFATQYEVALSAGIKDLFGNALGAPFSWTFTTEAQPPVAITLLSPSKGGQGSIVAIAGFGFDALAMNNAVTVGGQPASILSGDPYQLAVKLPDGLAEGGHPVVVTNLTTAQASNVLTFTLLQDEELPRGFDAGTAALGATPKTLMVNNDGGIAFVATDQGVTAVAVDPGDPDYLTTTPLPIPGGIDDLRVTPDGGQVYAVSTNSATVYRINGDPNNGPIAVLNETIVDWVPAAIVIEPSGRRAFISTAAGRIRIWDTREGSATFDREIGVMPSPFGTFVGGMTIDGAGQYLLALAGTGHVAVFDLSLNSFITQVPVGPRPRDVVIDPAGERAYVTDDNGTVTVVRLDTFERVIDITAGGQLRGIVSGPSGAYAHAVDRALDYINIIDLREDSPRFRSVAVRIPQPDDPVDVALSPDGSYAYSLIESDRTLHVNAVGIGPTVVSVAPQRGPVGSRVVISGRNFVTNAVNAVTFNGVQAPPVRVGEHALEVIVPAGATSGALSVKGTTTGGVPATSNEVYFRVLGASGAGTLNQIASVPSAPTVSTTAMSVSGDGMMVAGGGTTGEVTLVDTDRTSSTYNKVIATIPALGGAVEDVAFTPDGMRVYAVRSGLAEVRGYDTNRNSPTFGQLVGTIVLPGAGANRLAVSPDGNALVVGNPSTSTVDIADIRAGSATEHQVMQSLSTVDAGLSTNGAVGEMVFHPGGVYLYVAIQDDSPAVVSVLGLDTETKTATFVGSVPLGGSETPTSLSFTPDGASCLVLTSALGGPASRSVVTLGTSSPQSPAVAGAQVFASSVIVADEFIRVSPNGDRALMNLRDDGLYHLDITALPTVIVSEAAGGPVHTAPVRPAYVESDLVALLAASQLQTYDFQSSARSLALASGDGQTGVAGKELPSPLRVRITADGAGVPNVPVTFAATLGAGTFVSTGAPTLVAATDGSGYAQARLTSGPTVGPSTQQVTASALGVSGSPVVFTASTLADPELLPLTLVGVSPANGKTDVSVTTAVQATFSRALDPGTVNVSTFILKDFSTSSAISALIGLGTNNTRATLTPSAPLAYNTQYTLKIDGVRDLSNNSLTVADLLVFTTGSPPPLALNSISPPSAVAGVDVTLSGQSFAPTASGNTVRFAGTQALVREVGHDYVVVQVPLLATSGNVTVETAEGTSNGLPFTVLEQTSSPVDDVVGSVGTGSSARSIAISPDGTRAYAVSPDANLLVVIDLKKLRTLANISVGESPYAVTVHPEGGYAYVANLVDGTVSVVGAEPGVEGFNEVVESIVVGTSPVDLAVSPDGDRLVVANAGSLDLSIVDGDESSDTHHQVIASAGTGSSARTVSISADGGRWFIGNEFGYIVVSPLNYAVVASGSTGSATRSTAITPDGTLLIVLTELGDLFAFDVAPGSPKENQVIAGANAGASSRSLAISPDGGLLYVIQEDVDDILVFSLKIPRGTSVYGGDFVGEQFSLTAVDTIRAGENPSSIAFDPSGSGLMLVTNDGDQSVSVLDNTPAVLEAEVDVDADALSPGVSVAVELSPAFAPEDVDVANMTLSGSGSVPPVPAYTTIEDGDLDGVDEVHVVFDRQQFQQVIPQGEAVPLTIAGTVAGHAFAGVDTIVSYRPVITAPGAQALDPDTDFPVEWTSPPAANADAVDLHWTGDEGETWNAMALGIGDTGQYLWHVPSMPVQAARIMVRLVRNGVPIGSGVSEQPFMIDSPIPVRLAEFDGFVEKGAVRLHWKTATESGLSGFRVLRTAGAGVERDVTPALIEPQGRGVAYEFRDADVRPGVTYRYQLLEVDEAGEASFLRDITLTFRLSFALSQNVPNPFNPTTTIAYTIPEDGNVALVIYDVAGREVRTLVSGRERASYYEVKWDGSDNRGVRVASGVYFYRLVAGKHVKTRKMVLLK